MGLDNLILLAEEVSKLYYLMSVESQNYSSLNGITCKTGCGKCCDNPNIYASPLEMLPLAIEVYLKNSGSLKALKEVLEKCRSEAICVYYNFNEDPSKGSCGAYYNRPVVCRLFGWALVGSKRGKDLSVCGLLKDDRIMPKEGAPDIVLWANRVNELYPELSGILPINKAFAAALEKVMTAAYYS